MITEPKPSCFGSGDTLNAGHAAENDCHTCKYVAQCTQIAKVGGRSMIKILSSSRNMLQTIVRAARTCRNSEGSMDTIYEGTELGAKDLKLIKECIRAGHHSILEHASFTFKLDMSRACQQQFTRHRLGSFSIESMRHVKPGAYVYPNDDPAIARMYELAEQGYEGLMARGVPMEDARYVLPLGTLSKVIATANLREWRHIIAERMCKHAQAEIRTIATEIYKLIGEVSPILVWRTHKRFYGCPESDRGCRVCRLGDTEDDIDGARASHS